MLIPLCLVKRKKLLKKQIEQGRTEKNLEFRKESKIGGKLKVNMRERHFRRRGMKAEKMQRKEGHRDIFKKTEGEKEEGMKKTQNEGMNNRRKLKRQ